jgi:tetratricopeptide (TPR) repeat protein
MSLRKFAGLILLLSPAFAAPPVDCAGAAPYDCAVYLVQRRQFSPAITLLDKIVAQAPQDLKALNLLGIALTAAGQVEKANARFREVLKLDPAFYPALKNLAINEFTLNRLPEAKGHFEQVLKASPADDVAHLYLGEIAFERREFLPAIVHYERSRSRVDQSPVAVLHYAECLAQSGRLSDAPAVLAALGANDPQYQFQAGVLLGKAGAYRDAGNAFGLARKGSKDPYTAAYNQVLMLIRAGDNAAAIQLAADLFRQGMRRAELYNLISEAYLKSGQIEQAYNSLRTATELEPQAEDNYVDLAGICLDYENYDLGLEIVDIGLRHLPNSFRLRVHRGVMLAQKGLTQESEKEFEVASRLSPSQSLPYAALAMAWMQRGDTARAVEVLRQRVSQNPNDFMIPYILGIALIRSGAEPGTGMGAEARRAFETSVRLNPKFSRAHAELGKLLLKSGDVPAAVQYLETAVALDAKDGAAAYQLAQAYRRKGDTERAQEMLARVTKIRDEQEGIDPNAEMKRIVREGAASPSRTAAQ